MTSIEAKYQCSRCGDVHDFEDDAGDCCRPDVREIYECPSCKRIYHEMSSAVACCGFDENALPVVSAAEMERAGQLRLPLTTGRS
jgi:hypothetical protein